MRQNWWWAVVLALVVACSAEPPACVDSWERVNRGYSEEGRGVDLLFVVDGSEAMAVQRQRLARQLPGLIERLTAGVGSDGSRACKVWDLRVGVLNASAENVWGCPVHSSPFAEPGFLELDRDNVEGFVDEVLSMLDHAPRTCAIGDPLAFTEMLARDENSLAGTSEHFVRTNKVLAIVVLTNQSDPSECSQPAGCAGVTIAERVASLRGQKSAFDIVLMPLAGIPQDLLPLLDRDSWPAVLEDERMQISADGTGGPACTSEAGEAAPARRLAEFVGRAEERNVQIVPASICADSFDDAFDRFADQIMTVYSRQCVKPLPMDEEGVATCVLSEALPLSGEITRCEQLADRGRVFLRLAEDGREICTVCQMNAAGHNVDSNPACAGQSDGWIYEHYDPEGVNPCGRLSRGIAYTANGFPFLGGTSLECLHRVPPAMADRPWGRLDRPCDPELGGCDSDERAFVCDAVLGSCQMPCSDEEPCDLSGMPGYSCTDHDNDASTPRLCLSPMCPPSRYRL